MINELTRNKSVDFEPKDFSFGEKILKIDDPLYFAFLQDFNGGYFYDNSLHIFGYSKEVPHHDLSYINNLFKMLFGELSKDIIFFAEDIFGNPYGFENNTIVFFNIETSDKEVIGNNFAEWLAEIDNDLDYYTGQSLAKELSKDDKFQLAYGKRLAPKYPFVLGGEYTLENLILKDFEKNIDYNSSIAKQIVDLPDGSNVKIDIIK